MSISFLTSLNLIISYGMSWIDCITG